MLMAELIHFLHRSSSGTGDGGGDFLLYLSDATLVEKARGAGRNKLYGDLTKIDTSDEDAVYRLMAERRQRWYTARSKPMPKYIAKFWRANFYRIGFLEFIDRKSTHDTRNDWYAVFRANGYPAAAGQISELIADLFVTGLEHLAVGDPAIDNKPWNPDLAVATAAETATAVQTKQRFADLKPTDIYVDGKVLVVGTFRVSMPGQPSVPQTVSNYERRYVTQLVKVLCTECGIEVSLRALQEHGGEYLEDFNIARLDYYLADALRQLLKDSSLDGEEEFQKIKDDAYAGIRPTYRKRHASPYERMQATLEQSTTIPLKNSHIPEVTGLFSSAHRHGITHMLVNDDRLRWTDNDN